MAGVAKRVAGVWVDKVKESCVELFTARAGLKPASDATLEAKVRLLQDHLRNTTVKKQLAVCDVCGGVSPVAFDCCPFCGGIGVPDEPVVVIETTAEPVPDLPSNVRQIDFRAAKQASPEPKPEPEETPKQEVEEAKPVVIEVIGELGKNVAEILRLKEQAAVSLWELGSLLLENQEKQLWKLREKDSGKPAYVTFKQFLVAEVGFAPNYALKLIEVTRTFGRALVDKVGIGKLGVVLQVPPEMRVPLVDAAAAGATRRELQDLAKAAKDKAETPKPNAKLVTVALALRKQVIPLKARLKKGGKEKAAKQFTDGPWGEEELANGVICRYWVRQNKRGELELHLERKRRSEEE